MKVFVLKKPRTLELTNIPEYVMKEGNHVLIKAGICGSYLHYLAGENPVTHTLGRHIENPPNLVMDHEVGWKVEFLSNKGDEKAMILPSERLVFQ